MSETPELKDWERPYFTQAADTNLVYFVVYGNMSDQDLKIPGVPYRILYMPQNLQLNLFNQENNAETLEQFRSSVFADFLQAQHPDLVEKVKEQPNCFIVQLTCDDSNKLNDLRVAIGLTTYLLDSGCVAAFDLTTRKWWAPEPWRESIFESDEFNALAHVEIIKHAQENGTSWVHTLGMRKFGRPDLSIHQVTSENMYAVQEMLERFINFMALGGNIANGQEIKMKGLPEGMTCERVDDMDAPDFGNRYVEVNWPK